MKKIEHHPQIITIENFFTQKECNIYIKNGEEKGFEEAKVNLRGQQTMLKSMRDNERFLFFDEDLAKNLWDRIKEFIPQNSKSYTAFGLNEMFRIYKYTVGQKFKMHSDGSYKKSDSKASKYSFLIYLNDDFDGGETLFEDKFSIQPKKGAALLFKHYHRHEGKALVDGTKYVLRTDIMFQRKTQN